MWRGDRAAGTFQTNQPGQGFDTVAHLRLRVTRGCYSSLYRAKGGGQFEVGVIYVPQQWLTVRTSVGCCGQAEGGNWPHSEAMTTVVFPGARAVTPPNTK